MVVHGRVQADFAWSIIGDRSVVHVSASEIVLGKPVLGFGPLVFAWAYNIGHADVWVSNISPRDGGVTLILHVNWGFTPSCGDHDHCRGTSVPRRRYKPAGGKRFNKFKRCSPAGAWSMWEGTAR